MTLDDMGDLDARILATEQALREAVRALPQGWISGDGRIGESTLADLLGLACGSLANMRLEGKAPPYFRLGGGGHKVTYRLSAVAAWLEAKHEV